VFLEIWYTIFKNFTPQQIFMSEEGERAATEDIIAKERARDRRINFLRGMRHSKFGSQIEVKRADGSSAIVQNIYQETINLNAGPKNQRMKPVSTKVNGVQ
jgi:hypothetical protein